MVPFSYRSTYARTTTSIESSTKVTIKLIGLDHRHAQSSSSFEECQQVIIELILVCPWQSMRCTRIDLQSRVLDEFGGGVSRSIDRDDLVVAAMNDKGWYIKLLEVPGEICFGKRLDAVELILKTALHALKPERIADTLAYVRTRPVDTKERSRELFEEL